MTAVNDTELFLDWWVQRNSKPGFYGTATVQGITVAVHKGVYSPDPTCTHAPSMLMEVVCDPRGKDILDIGTGTGILAIYAAQNGARRVTATDIQPEAVTNAIANVKTFGFGNTISVLKSDLFEEITESYDIVIANLPFMDPAWTELNRIAVETNARFFAQLQSHLNVEGKAYITCSSWADVTSLEKMISLSQLSCNVYKQEARQAIWYAYELSYARD